MFEGASFVAQRRRLARRAASRLPPDGRAHGLGARRQRLAPASRGRARRSSRATRAITRPACWACATTSTTTAFPAWCSACPAASIRRFARRWRSTRSGRSASTRSCCPTATPPSESLRDAAACAKALGIRYDIVPIAEPVEGVEHALARRCSRAAPRDITEENIQSRARGLILMSISNKFGAMVVTTGNKSEMSVGYATLYGDMNGGFNPIKDLYKMEVFRLCRLAQPLEAGRRAGAGRRVIPPEIITKPPSAELRENQKDEDSLPPYAVLDGILNGLVEKEMRVADIVARGYDSRRCAGRAAAVPRRIQAPAVGAGREGRPEELWPRPALPDRQPLPRFRRCRRKRPTRRLPFPYGRDAVAWPAAPQPCPARCSKASRCGAS